MTNENGVKVLTDMVADFVAHIGKKLPDDVVAKLEELGSQETAALPAWFALGRAAKEMGMPMLGICKGIQFLNVLCGGDLYQDIYTQKETTILHLQSLERSYLHHHVEIKVWRQRCY